jgi:hypothetical protein
MGEREMTKDEILKLAREAGFAWKESGALTQGHTLIDVEIFARLVRDAALEEAAAAVDSWSRQPVLEIRALKENGK